MAGSDSFRLSRPYGSHRVVARTKMPLAEVGCLSSAKFFYRLTIESRLKPKNHVGRAVYSG